MIISKKRFNREVTKKARELREAERISSLVRSHDKKIKELRWQIEYLEEEVNELTAVLPASGQPNTGTIKGFYQDQAGDYYRVPCTVTENMTVPD